MHVCASALLPNRSASLPVGSEDLDLGQVVDVRGFRRRHWLENRKCCSDGTYLIYFWSAAGGDGRSRVVSVTDRDLVECNVTSCILQLAIQYGNDMRDEWIAGLCCRATVSASPVLGEPKMVWLCHSMGMTGQVRAMLKATSHFKTCCATIDYHQAHDFGFQVSQ